MRKRYLVWVVLGLTLVACWAIIQGRGATNGVWMRGDRLSEPIGIVNTLVVTRETLVFDWSSLAAPNSNAAPETGASKRGLLTTTYEIRNAGNPVAVRLLFSSFGMNRGRVTLDDQQLSITPATTTPATTLILSNSNVGLQSVRLPQFGGSPTNDVDTIDPNRMPSFLEPWNSQSGDRHVATFSDLEQQVLPRLADPNVSVAVTIPSGSHTLTVRYPVRPYTYQGDHIYQDYVIGYGFAPEPSWQRVERFDLEVRVPSNWDVASSLPTLRRRDIVWGTYLGLPADGFAIALRYPLHPLAQLTSLGLRSGGIALGLMVASRGTLRAMPWSDRPFKLSNRAGLPPKIGLVGLSLLAFLVPATVGIWLSYRLLYSPHLSMVWQQDFFILHGGLLLAGAIASIGMALNQRQLGYHSESQS